MKVIVGSQLFIWGGRQRDTLWSKTGLHSTRSSCSQEEIWQEHQCEVMISFLAYLLYFQRINVQEMQWRAALCP